LYKGSIGDIRN